MQPYRDQSFKVKGAIFMFCGADSGAGKTTMANIIMDALRVMEESSRSQEGYLEQPSIIAKQVSPLAPLGSTLHYGRHGRCSS
jgi:hypothetical protein